MKKVLRNPYFTFVVLSMAAVMVSMGCSSPRTLRSTDFDPVTLRRVDSLCMRQMEMGHFPGLAVGIANRKTSWSKGYGFADIEHQIPVDPADHLFRIGSISKTVTAAALAREIQKGKINLDEPIDTYYKDLPADKQQLTLRQVAGHLAGIRHYQGDEFFSTVHYSNIFEPLEVFIHDSLLFAPGTRFSYSTYGWTLVSAVMEKAVGKSFTDIVRDDVSEPLHLTQLKPDQVDSAAYHRVTFYYSSNDTLLVAPFVDNSNKWAGGGFLCTTDDLIRFGAALTGPGYVKKKVFTTCTTTQYTSDGKPTGNGIGFFNGTEEDGDKWYGHSGGSVGGTSMLLIYPDRDLVIVTLVNLSSARMDDLARKIAELIPSSRSKKRSQ